MTEIESADLVFVETKIEQSCLYDALCVFICFGRSSIICGCDTDVFAPSAVTPKTMYMDARILDTLAEHLPYNLEIEFDKSRADIVVEITEEGYHVSGSIGIYEKQALNQLIQGYHQFTVMETMPDYMISVIDEVLNAHIVWPTSDESQPNHLGFMVITSIYFMLLSLSTAVANEVINEKTSNVIEIILTSVSHRHHYYSKLLIGWLTMFSQMMIHGLNLTFWLMVRTVYDQGRGLFEMLFHWGWLSTRLMTIGDLVSSLNIQTSHIILVIMCSIFLMLGILLVQLFMVLVSVHINSIEEAAAIQGPFYLGMLVVYYLAIFLNSSDQLNQGIGYILSYVPVFSMLFMPSRLLTVQVYSSELWLSMIIACFTLVAGMLLGEKHYRNNLLKGSGKGPYVKK